ncbi:hypothetical protein [Lactiplantibacillus fabifermentans]|uniref:Uncharacterized protein n=2 Tax=Lactiplantibacillus fabifermentans TaxID=483011 RepID=A0A0R2P080_9LACO|nr:hypothetical protein [Lactiplantibacillus fabifermentans]ETY73029.1 hypothetical protein LFAB_14635 [Lactiplantibacillus fabifermentans T30PCM01]KRO29059.1 hypothetical protein DY78_GL001467 [Lactiplantibacillus fabifermentans DSM 21115]
MEITIDLIIGTSAILMLLCWFLAVHYFRVPQKWLAIIWLVAGIIFAGLMGFFIYAAIPLWTSI